MTIKDVMAKYKTSRTTVYKWIKNGLPVHRIGKLLRFNESEVEGWVCQYEKK
jgi:excisionase family DNA binding protein